MVNAKKELGEILKRRRQMMSLTLRKLAEASGISPSYLGRLESGERFPSASVLKKIAPPLGLEEAELFSMAGYLSPPSTGINEKGTEYSGGELDPYVRQVLSAEPVEIQRTVIGILNILKSIARVPEENRG
jgi:transcriptional regulator with XRE-family HTH domain